MAEDAADGLVLLAGVHDRMRFDGGRIGLDDAEDAVDLEAEGLAAFLDDDDPPVGMVAVFRGGMAQLLPRVDDGDDRPAQGDDADDALVRVRHARDGARRDDLDDVLDVHGVLLAGKNEGEELELRGGGRGVLGLVDEAFALRAGFLFEFFELA